VSVSICSGFVASFSGEKNVSVQLYAQTADVDAEMRKVRDSLFGIAVLAGAEELEHLNFFPLCSLLMTTTLSGIRFLSSELANLR
jgi:hypothetical protein